VKFVAALLLALGLLAPVAPAEQTANDRPAGVDEKLWKLLVEIDARGARVKDLKADFTQQKFTPLLKKPLTSTGTILIKGSASLWHTTHPEPTVMRIDDKELRLLYPRQQVLEVYPTGQKIASLATSPFPRLDVLKKHFTFEQIATKALDSSAKEGDTIALRMQPTEPELRKHIDEVQVLLQVSTGFVLKAVTIDSDGDRVALSFSNIRINGDVPDRELELVVPTGVKVTHPLEGDGK
jgi:outer membrane lipoprotein-sorting protein